MKKNPAQALGEFLTLLEEDRATLDDFLARYPQYTTDVHTLLDLAEQVQRAPQPSPGLAASAAGKRARRHAPVFRLALAVVPMLLLLVIIGVSLKSWFGATVTQTATLGQVSGAVDILPAGSGTWQPATTDAQVGTGDRIRTGSLSAATLVFFDGSTTDLEAETEITVAQMSSRRDGNGRVIVFHQWLGETHNRVQRTSDLASRFEIETPAAVASVRGTEFVLGVEPDGTTDVVVIEGTVNVMAQEVTVAVQAGQATVTQPKQSPARPVSISAPTPQPPGQTRTPQPPGLTRTPQPPGLTRTPQPPGLTRTPQPPGLTKTRQPPGLTRTPQPPGLTKTPQPPGLTRTPQPPGQNRTPRPKKTPKPKK